jgi:hypothetical protein
VWAAERFPEADLWRNASQLQDSVTQSSLKNNPEGPTRAESTLLSAEGTGVVTRPHDQSLADHCFYGEVRRGVNNFALEQRHQAFQVFDLVGS